MLFNDDYSYGYSKNYYDEIQSQSKPMDSSFNWLYFMGGSLLVAMITLCVYKRIMRNNEQNIQVLIDEQEPGSPRRYLTI